MFKYKKIILFILLFLFIVLSLIELIVYFRLDSTFFGLIYLLCNLLIIFLYFPTVYNYNKQYNLARASKLFLIVLFGIFNSFILSSVIKTNYIDSSIDYINKIFIIKNILKPIIYFCILVFAFFESKLNQLIKKRIRKEVD